MINKPSILRLTSAAAALLIASAASALIELPGSTQATFQWAAASGPVSGYHVYVTLNGGAEVLYSSVIGQTEETIQGSLGDTIEVSIAAFDELDREGPRSPSSEPVRFVALPPTTTTTTTLPPTTTTTPTTTSTSTTLPPAPTTTTTPTTTSTSTTLPPATTTTTTPTTTSTSTTLPPATTTTTTAPPPITTTTTLPPLAQGTAPLDFDGDGLSDMLLRQRRTTEIRVLAMQGAAVIAEFPLPPLSGDVEIVGNDDYDGDGMADALCLDELGQLEVWLIRNGAVAARRTLGEPLGEGFSVVGSGDFDGDGRADVAVHNQQLGILEIWYLDGTLLLEIVEFVDAPGRGWNVAGTGDYDGDRIAEVLWHRRQKGELLLWRFANGGVAESALRAFASGARLQGIGDLDGDGRSDLLAKSSDGTLSLALVGPAGVVDWARLRGNELRYIASGDFDGDGRGDLVFKHRESKDHFVYFMNGLAVDQIEPLAPLERGWYEAGIAD